MTAWTIVRQAPLSMGILQARVLNGLPHPPPGDLPNPGIEPRSSTLQVDSESELPRNPKNTEEGSLSLLQGESWLGLETVNLPRARSGHIAPSPGFWMSTPTPFTAQGWSPEQVQPSVFLLHGHNHQEGTPFNDTVMFSYPEVYFTHGLEDTRVSR